VILTAGGCLVAAAADTPADPFGSGSTSAPTNGTATPATTANSSVATDSAPNDLADLARFLSLPPERITQLRKALDYLDSMSKAQRDALLRDVQARQNSLRQLRQDINTDLQQLSPADRSILGRYGASLFPEDLQALIKRFHDAGDNADARKAIVQEMLKKAADLGIKAAPPSPPNTGPRGGPPMPGRGRKPADGAQGTPHLPAPAASSASASTSGSP
jgi:hypothetical protein